MRVYQLSLSTFVYLFDVSLHVVLSLECFVTCLAGVQLDSVAEWVDYPNMFSSDVTPGKCLRTRWADETSLL